MADATLMERFAIEAADFNAAGDASSTIKGILKKLGIDGKIIRRVSIASYEAELNMVIHSDGGELSLSVDPKIIILNARDKGPGIEDIELAMTEGYSTASESIRMMGFGAGMGLPNMKRCADEFSIESDTTRGTNIRMGFRIG